MELYIRAKGTRQQIHYFFFFFSFFILYPQHIFIMFITQLGPNAPLKTVRTREHHKSLRTNIKHRGKNKEFCICKRNSCRSQSQLGVHHEYLPSLPLISLRDTAVIPNTVINIKSVIITEGGGKITNCIHNTEDCIRPRFFNIK